MRNPITISEQIHKDKLIPSVYYPNMDEPGYTNSSPVDRIKQEAL